MDKEPVIPRDGDDDRDGNDGGGGDGITTIMRDS